MPSKIADGGKGVDGMTSVRASCATRSPIHRRSSRNDMKEARDGKAEAQGEVEDAREGIHVVVRVRPLSLTEHADSSMRNCVQCLKDCVIVGGTSTITPSSRMSTENSNTAGKDGASAGAGGGGHSLSGGGSNSSSTQSGPKKPKVYGTRTEAALRACQFHVDDVLHPHTTQIEVYERTCRRIVAGVFEGVNGAILAYGATGSGKTHTMFGSTLSAAGIVYQSIQDIFAEKRRLEAEEKKTVSIRCSFVEIYNEEVFDLLVPCSPPALRRMQQGAGLGAGSPTMHKPNGNNNSSSSPRNHLSPSSPLLRLPGGVDE